MSVFTQNLSFCNKHLRDRSFLPQTVTHRWGDRTLIPTPSHPKKRSHSF
ncbi:MAG: hypothetical protein U7126_04340 [Microcoleus sp.]